MKFKQLGSMFIILFSTLLLVGCEKKEHQTSKTVLSLPNATVSVDKVTKETAAKQVEIVGTIQAVEQAEIASKITGNIIIFQVDLGSKVNQGDLLVELSAGEISAQLQQAKAQLEQAKRNLAREEKLLKKNAATPKTVKSLQDSTRIAEGAYKEALTMLSYTKIVAPFSGIVTRKLASVGDLATPGKPLLHIEKENDLQVITDIPEAMILRVKKGDRLQVFVPSVELSTEGVVTEVSPIADPSSRSAPIKLKIKSDPRLRSGQFARITLALEQAETLTIPEGALSLHGQMERVFVENDGKARLRLVRTGAHTDGRIEILSGLKENEMVVVEGSQDLLDGQPVTIK